MASNNNLARLAPLATIGVFIIAALGFFGFSSFTDIVTTPTPTSIMTQENLNNNTHFVVDECMTSLVGYAFEEDVTQGYTKTYSICPDKGDYKFSRITADDKLTSIVVVCDEASQISIPFSSIAKEDELLPWYESESFSVGDQCRIDVTIQDTEAVALRVWYTLSPITSTQEIGIPKTPEEAAQKWGGKPSQWELIDGRGWKVIGTVELNIETDWRVDYVDDDTGNTFSCAGNLNSGKYGPITVISREATLWYVPGEIVCPNFIESLVTSTPPSIVSPVGTVPVIGVPIDPIRSNETYFVPEGSVLWFSSDNATIEIDEIQFTKAFRNNGFTFTVFGPVTVTIKDFQGGRARLDMKNDTSLLGEYDNHGESYVYKNGKACNFEIYKEGESCP